MVIAACYVTPAVVLLPLNLRPDATVELKVTATRVTATAAKPPADYLGTVAILGDVSTSALNLRFTDEFAFPPDFKVLVGTTTFSKIKAKDAATETIIWFRAPGGSRFVVSNLNAVVGKAFVVSRSGSDRALDVALPDGGSVTLNLGTSGLTMESQNLVGNDQTGALQPLPPTVNVDDAALVQIAVPKGGLSVTARPGEHLAGKYPISGHLAFSDVDSDTSIVGAGSVVIQDTGKKINILPGMSVSAEAADPFVMIGLQLNDGTGIDMSFAGSAKSVKVGWLGGPDILPTLLERIQSVGFLVSYFGVVLVIGSAILSILNRLKIVETDT
ncbi:hypothetical protein NKI31_12710 [Mesorhizobium sp. M0659]|uniref:hypothetical protein n=1 Tax=Mesorhizobium sp. M0659 TaxID=2956980 RepID=UPI0033363935